MAPQAESMDAVFYSQHPIGHAVALMSAQRHLPEHGSAQLEHSLQPLFTIGYEETTQAAVLDALRAAGITLLVDVRAIAASRRPGFAKSQLAAGVAGVGIGYLHLRGLGTPPAGRLAARTGRHDEMRRIYGEHLAGAEAGLGLAQLAELVASGQRVCLLCLERQPHHCHRSLIAERLADDIGCAVEHLAPAGKDGIGL